MQVRENKDFPEILFGIDQEKDKRSITLKPGNEYEIELEPYGQYTTEDFKAMALEKRKCRLDHEIFDNSTHPIYTKANCKFDCHVNLAYHTCKCIPWDFVNKHEDATECDVFGRTCFFNMIETLTHGSDQNCSYCLDECDFIKYRKHLIRKTEFQWELEEFASVFGTKYTLTCNKYICHNPRNR